MISVNNTCLSALPLCVLCCSLNNHVFCPVYFYMIDFLVLNVNLYSTRFAYILFNEKEGQKGHLKDTHIKIISRRANTNRHNDV